MMIVIEMMMITIAMMITMIWMHIHHTTGRLQKTSSFIGIIHLKPNEGLSFIAYDANGIPNPVKTAS